eukprot:CAMPEP_0171062002 /NCGR_PEP_ID=MMETSP0766_2-20121228/4801_1 /TAXON_ID=439317 /ORGANISM="Gambierdiscus australes, Strain CAWD 149" /LENGTH=50 /DNA_ID=CAMNT_0011517759 /DNA_START=878 /DNA_END=1030 /DNA_ORIENTATION=+
MAGSAARPAEAPYVASQASAASALAKEGGIGTSSSSGSTSELDCMSLSDS